MHTSIKLLIFHTFSSIYFFGSVACAFAITPRPTCNNIHQAATMPPNQDFTYLESTFGTFDRHPLLSQHRGQSHNGYQNQRLHPLAMIPNSRSQYEQNRNRTCSSRSQAFLGATKRTNEDRATLQELTPEMPKEDTGLASIVETITNSISLLTNTLASSKKLQGRATLLLVALLYGTLNVVLRGVYATEGPPVASVLSLVRQVLSVLTFIPLLAFSTNASDMKGNDFDFAVETSSIDEEVEKVRPMWLAALELAFWNFGAQVSLVSAPHSHRVMKWNTSNGNKTFSSHRDSSMQVYCTVQLQELHS